MPAPSSADFDRLARLVAITHPDERPCQEIHEVFTGRLLASIPIGNQHDVEVAFQNARIAQSRWINRSVADRCDIIKRYRKLVIAHQDFLMDVAQAETGKARSAAQEEILDIILNSYYYAKHAPRLLAPSRVPGMLPGITKTVITHHPKGVVGVISPWNYPMTLSISDAIPALLAGNGVVLKPDSKTPYCALAHVELLYEAGIPRELLQVVPGPGTTVGSALVDHCDYLMFTGSTETGKLLAQQCGQRLIGFSAELGGKNPMIITDGANIDTVAQVALRACFSNAGQLCIAIERIYIQREVYAEFVEKFVRNVQKMKLSSAYNFRADMGSLISSQQMQKVCDHVHDALDKGATLLTGGRARPDIGPLFYEPTVLAGVTDQMKCAREETFGPVVSLYCVESVDEAIAHANDSMYGLNASVWSFSKDAGEKIAYQLESGTVNVNEGYALTFGSTSAPMGGMKASGLGRRHGPDGLLKYTEPQTISTSRFTILDPPTKMIPPSLWQKIFIPLLQLVQTLPRK